MLALLPFAGPFIFIISFSSYYSHVLIDQMFFESGDWKMMSYPAISTYFSALKLL